MLSQRVISNTIAGALPEVRVLIETSTINVDDEKAISPRFKRNIRRARKTSSIAKSVRHRQRLKRIKSRLLQTHHTGEASVRRQSSMLLSIETRAQRSPSWTVIENMLKSFIEVQVAKGANGGLACFGPVKANGSGNGVSENCFESPGGIMLLQTQDFV